MSTYHKYARLMGLTFLWNM